MALKTTVIINEVTNLSDARYCAGMGVDSIGFRIDESHDKYVDLANYKEITDWVAGIKFIGESSEIIDQNAISYNVDQLLLDNIDLLPQYIGKPALWSLPVNKIDSYRATLTDHATKINGVILTSQEVEFTENHKTQMADLPPNLDVFISFGINSDNVLELIKKLPIKGLSLSGSDEIRPGYKDYDKLADILEKLEEED